MGVLSSIRPHIHPRLHKPISKVLLMYRYIIVATTYFSGRYLSQTISCFRYGFHRCQKFKYILKMQLWEPTFSSIYLNQKKPFTCVPQKSCSEIFQIIRRKTPVQESLSVWAIFFHCFILSLPSYCIKTLLVHSKSTFPLFLLH